MEDPSKKSISMIRSFVLADIITLANAGFGMAAIFLCLNRVTDSRATYFWAVFLLLPLALVCDVLDGFVAHRLSGNPFSGPIWIRWPISFPSALRPRSWGLHWDCKACGMH